LNDSFYYFQKKEKRKRKKERRIPVPEEKRIEENHKNKIAVVQVAAIGSVS